MDIQVAERGESGATLEPGMDAVLGRLGVAVRWTTTSHFEVGDLFAEHAHDPSIVARVWIDLEDLAHARVYLSDRDSQRYLVRDIPLHRGLDDVACETIATIAESAVEALREGTTIGVSRTEAEALLAPSSPPPSPPPPSERHERVVGPVIRVVLGLHYEVAGMGAPVTIADGPGVLALFALRRPRVHPALWVNASAHLPTVYNGNPIGASLTATTVRALAANETQYGSRVTLRFGIGGGADITYVSPFIAAGASADLAPPHLATVAVARGALGMDVRLTGGLAISVAVACDVDLTPNTYSVLLLGTTPMTVVAPWVVQPIALLGLAWDFGFRSPN